MQADEIDPQALEAVERQQRFPLPHNRLGLKLLRWVTRPLVWYQNRDVPSVGRTVDRTIPGPGGRLDVRLYCPVEYKYKQLNLCSIMKLQEKVKAATCRVDDGDEQLGTAFWIDKQRLLTANHVVDGVSDVLSISTDSGEVLDGEIINRSEDSEVPGTDLALLESSDTPDDAGILSVTSRIPEIGSEVMWSGYARLFGEGKIDRQRFGWGRIASDSYGVEQGKFFEVDGLFNPGHSGGPVIKGETGDVVGVVSASAGDFEKLEQEWTERVRMLQELFKLQQAGGMLFRTFTYEDPENAIHDHALFQQLGLSVETETDNDGNMQLKINTEEIPIAAGKFQAEMGELLLDTAIATFQMGVGIASGGDPLETFLSD